MRDTSKVAGYPIEKIEDALLRLALCVAAIVALVMAVVLSSPYVVAAVGLTAAVSGAVAAYRANEERRDFRVPLDEAWHAAILAMNDNGFSYGEQTWCRTTAARVEGGRATVVVERHPGDVTRVRVRVGAFPFSDNRRCAALLLESVARHLR